MVFEKEIKPIYTGSKLDSFLKEREKYDDRELRKVYPTAKFKYNRDSPTHLQVASKFLRSLRDKGLHAEDINKLYQDALVSQDGKGALKPMDQEEFMLKYLEHSSKLKKGRLKDLYQNKFSLGVAPRYNPIGYVGRGYGALKGLGKGSNPDLMGDLLSGKVKVKNIKDPEKETVKFIQDIKDDEYVKAMKARGALYKNKKGNYEEIARGDVKHNLRFQSNFNLTPVVKKYSNDLKKNPITNVLNNGLGKLLKNKDNYKSYDFGLEKGFKEAVKKVTKKQSLSEAIYLPLIGGATSSAVGLYDNSFGSMKGMPKYNKRNFQIGSALVGTGAGLALSDAHPALRGAGFITGVTGMELMRRSKFGPRVGEISNIAGDGSSTVAAVNGSGI